MKSNNCNERIQISLLSPKMNARLFLLSLGQVFTPRPRKTGQSCRLEKSLVAMITAMLTFLSSWGWTGKITRQNHRADWFHCEVWSPRQMRCRHCWAIQLFPNQLVVQFPEITVPLSILVPNIWPSPPASLPISLHPHFSCEKAYSILKSHPVASGKNLSLLIPNLLKALPALSLMYFPHLWVSNVSIPTVPRRREALNLLLFFSTPSIWNGAWYIKYWLNELKWMLSEGTSLTGSVSSHVTSVTSY